MEKVRTIKLTMTGLKKKNVWKMKYLRNDQQEQSIRFVSQILLEELFKLQDLVKAKNPDAIIENSSHTFDADQ